VFMTPVFSCDSNSCSWFINNEWNVFLSTNFSNLLIESWSCNSMIKETDWFNDNCLYWMKSVFSIFNHFSKVLDDSFFFLSVYFFKITHWILNFRHFTLSPAKRRDSNSRMTTNSFNTSQSLWMIVSSECQNSSFEILCWKIFRGIVF